MSRTTLRSRGQVTLPADVRRALHVDEGDDIAFTVTDDNTVIMHGLTTIPADQAWFWREEWQAGEQEASEDIAAGRVERFANAEEMFTAWDRERGLDDGSDV